LRGIACLIVPALLNKIAQQSLGKTGENEQIGSIRPDAEKSDDGCFSGAHGVECRDGYFQHFQTGFPGRQML